LLVLQVFKVSPVLKVHRDAKELKVSKELLDDKALLAQQVTRELLVLKVSRDPLDFKVLKVSKEHQDDKEQ
jgi:hypothetical protein